MSDDYRQLANSLLRQFSETTTRYAPKIMRERCPWCGGSGLCAIGVGPLAKLETCHGCCSKGYVLVESTS